MVKGTLSGFLEGLAALGDFCAHPELSRRDAESPLNTVLEADQKRCGRVDEPLRGEAA
jgi:hypothetical protein